MPATDDRVISRKNKSLGSQLVTRIDSIHRGTEVWVDGSEEGIVLVGVWPDPTSAKTWSDAVHRIYRARLDLLGNPTGSSAETPNQDEALCPVGAVCSIEIVGHRLPATRLVPVAVGLGLWQLGIPLSVRIHDAS